MAVLEFIIPGERAVADRSRLFYLEMGHITAITPQQRLKDRVNVFMDGRYAFSLALVVARDLRVGQELSPADIERLQGADTLEKAKASALRFLGYRPRSQAEVERNLARKGFDPAVIEQIIHHLRQVQLLDDSAFGRYWVEQREAFRPRSQRALHMELRQKGLEREEIEQALTDFDESDAAYRAAVKQASRWVKLPKELFYQKMGGYLQRRGFSYDTIREITNRIWQELAAEQS